MNLTTLVVLACPVSMGVMMWLMMRGGNQGQAASTGEAEQHRRVAALERELAELREQQQQATIRGAAAAGNGQVQPADARASSSRPA